MAQPVVSYPGAKWKFIKDGMLDYFPIDMKVFVEPFFGGGSVSLSVADDTRFSKLERMVGGDLYTEMWALWTGIKTNPSGVIEIAESWMNSSCPHQKQLYETGFIAEKARAYMLGGKYEDFEKSEELAEYEKQRIRDNLVLYSLACNEGAAFWEWSQKVDITQLSLEQRAARMLLVNKISFSGMGDAGSMSRDQFTSFRLDKLDTVYSASKLLQRIELYNVSFEETMKIAEQTPNDSFIFLDPPYAAQENSGLYGKGGNTHRGFPHEHFAEFTKQMRSRWFMTYDDSVVVRKLFSGLTVAGTPVYIQPYKTVYTMAGKTAEDALAGEELFISNMDLNSMFYNDDFNF